MDISKIRTLKHICKKERCLPFCVYINMSLQAHVGASGETMYDQRLFNQEGGMASGLASDDTYNLYDKALFADRGNNLYKPRTNTDDDAEDADGKTRTFKPDKASLKLAHFSWHFF